MHSIRLDALIADRVDLLSQEIEDKELALRDMEQDLGTDEHDAHDDLKRKGVWSRRRTTTRVSWAHPNILLIAFAQILDYCRNTLLAGLS